MRAKDKLLLRLRSLFRRRHVDQELDSELQFHLDQLTEENIAAGMAPQEALRTAQLTMGNVTHLEEECRDMRRLNFIDDLSRDLRYAGRNSIVTVGVSVLTQGPCISVEDNGPGVPPAFLERLGERFFRGPRHAASTNRRVRSAGAIRWSPPLTA